MDGTLEASLAEWATLLKKLKYYYNRHRMTSLSFVLALYIQQIYGPRLENI